MFADVLPLSKLIALAGRRAVAVPGPLLGPLYGARSLVRGILVNGDGRRFLNEDTYAGRLGQEFLLRQDGAVYFVHDDDTVVQ